MGMYTGESCPVCQSTFGQNDDVVVCPICGAPYHRACYQKQGACLFEKRHEEGFVWKPAHREEDMEPCPLCRNLNPKNAKECSRCGTIFIRTGGDTQRKESVSGGWQPSEQSAEPRYDTVSFDTFGSSSAADAYHSALGGISQDMDFDGVSSRDMAIFLGDRSAYFLPRFAFLKSSARSFSLNFPAFLLTFVYFFYRKMYKVGAIVLAIWLLLLTPQLLLLPQWVKFVAENFSQLMSGMDVVRNFTLTSFTWVPKIQPALQVMKAVLLFCCGIFANRLYYHHCVEQILKIRKSTAPQTGKSSPNADESAVTSRIAYAGRTSIGSAVAVIALCVVAYFVLVYILSAPYMDLMYQSLSMMQ